MRMGLPSWQSHRIRNLDMEHSYNTHRAAPGLISVRWSDNRAQAALYCSYFNRLPSPALHTPSRNTHEGRIYQKLSKPDIEKTQQLEKTNRQKYGRIGQASRTMRSRAFAVSSATLSSSPSDTRCPQFENT